MNAAILLGKSMMSVKENLTLAPLVPPWEKKRNRLRHLWFWLLLCLAALTVSCGGAPSVSAEARETRQTEFEKGKALFEEKCRTVAGEKIYRRVENVEGILLLKIRPARGDKEWADRMWPGAAFARESPADEYITTFLAHEYAPGNANGTPGVITPKERGYINTTRRPGGLPGYRYVDVLDEKDGQRYRYTGRWEEPWQYDKAYLKGYIKFFLEKNATTATAPRYGVTFEDHIIPNERYLGIASSTVRVIDLETQEVLGEMLRYAWSGGGPSSANPSPWLTALRCPDHTVGTNAATRKLVDQILVPAKEE